jgi:4-hydroxybenzoate polyprenyltransferase
MSFTDADNLPLVIDLDGTLLRSDVLYESTLKLLRAKPWLVFALPFWLGGGKARLKQEIANRVELDIASLPFDEEVMAWIRSERARGRHVALCSASDTKCARGVADHLGLFDEVIASDGQVNVSAHRKAQALTERYGKHGFDYAGNSSDDLPVWEGARHAIVVSASPRLRARARNRFHVEREFERAGATLWTWVGAMRIHQWSKNLLLFIPLLGAHRIFELELLGQALLAFFAFGLCASSVYLVNDLMDLESDRRHPRKRNRPFAAGRLSALAGAIVAILALIAAFGIALNVTPAFLAWLAVYFAVTLAYTFWLKRKVMIDVLSLSGLYMLRVIAGVAAVGVALSFWLLALCLFLFLSLAFVKRYSELQVMVAEGREQAHGRGYRTGDLPLVEMFGIVAGFSAVLVLALYINGDAVQQLYRRPEVMWLTVPILLYWVGRIWVIAHRGLMHDDPLLFAFRDRISLVSGAAFLAVLSLAAVPW